MNFAVKSFKTLQDVLTSDIVPKQQRMIVLLCYLAFVKLSAPCMKVGIRVDGVSYIFFIDRDRRFELLCHSRTGTYEMSSSMQWDPIADCANCSKPAYALRACLGCSKVVYCDRVCQKVHWRSSHRGVCDRDGNQ